MSPSHSQQKLHSLSIKSLKNISELEILFDGKNITGIFGANGCGKSTIIHALACCYQPPENSNSEDYKFSNFFLPTSDSTWSGSDLSITYSYRDGKNEYLNQIHTYKKTDRWTIYARRPYRSVYYFGIENCVPLIEQEKKTSKITFQTKPAIEKDIQDILEYASLCLNQKYTTYNIHKTSSKTTFGVEVSNLQYSAFSMSAGEQKVFEILKYLIKAEKYSLILIDELDLLLHDLALKRLLKIMSEAATKKKFTNCIFFTSRIDTISISSCKY